MPPGRSGTSVMSTLRSGNRIEPGTSRTLSENYTPKPTSRESMAERTHARPRTLPTQDLNLEQTRTIAFTRTRRQTDGQRADTHVGPRAEMLLLHTFESQTLQQKTTPQYSKLTVQYHQSNHDSIDIAVCMCM